MITEFITRFDANRDKLREQFAKNPPSNYEALVKAVVDILKTDEYGGITSERLHTIDDGDYQGTLLFVIGAEGYQPSTYWYVKVSYGSCSGCDTLEAIDRSYDGTVSEQALDDYMMLALHIVQGLKLMED
jgi:hypothetical protein